MSPNSPSPDRFWLLIGESPCGPFTGQQIHQKLNSTEIAWQTQACRFGENTWRPLVEIPGIGPMTLPPAPRPDQITARANPLGMQGSTGATVQTQTPSPSPQRSEVVVATQAGNPAPTTPPANWGAIVGCLCAAALVIWIGYSWLRPLTPREVSQRFTDAATAKVAKGYCTSNLHLAVDALFRQQTPNDPRDIFELMDEQPAPPDMGGYFVWYRGQIFIPAERRRLQMDGVFHVIKADMWKIEDMYIVSIDRQPWPVPISLASNYALLLSDPLAAGPIASAGQHPGAAPIITNPAIGHMVNKATKGTANFMSSSGISK